MQLLTTRRRGTKPLAIDVDGQILNIRYYPKRLRPAAVRALYETGQAFRKALTKAEAQPTDTPEMEGDPKEDAADPVEAMLKDIDGQLEAVNDLVEGTIEAFVDEVAEWDLEDDGVPIPITQEAIIAADIDIPLLTLILSKIQEDQSVSPSSARNSGARS